MMIGVGGLIYHVGDARHISRLIGALDTVEGAIAIWNQEPGGHSLPMPFA